MDIDSNNDRFTCNTAFSTGIWYHIALVFDGTLAAASRAKLYVNGVLDITADETSATIPSYNSPLKVGLIHTGATTFLDGLADDVRLYRRALPASEVAMVADGNFAPTVSCGTAPSAANGIAANLAGTASNDIAGTLTTAWSKVSGPGTATFGNVANPATTVTFNQPGAYALRLTATNSAAQDFTEITVNVAANPNIFTDWQSLTWPGVTDVNIIGPLADPDRDGLQNLTEWALGLSATQPGVQPASVAKVGADLEFTYTRAKNVTGVTITVEWSNTLANDWSSMGVTEQILSDNGTVQTVRASVAAGAGGRRFLHLKVSKP